MVALSRGDQQHCMQLPQLTISGPVGRSFFVTLVTVHCHCCWLGTSSRVETWVLRTKWCHCLHVFSVSVALEGRAYPLQHRFPST